MEQRTIRQTMAGVATIGALDTAYGTYLKQMSLEVPSALCSTTSSAGTSCQDVLNGPYASLSIMGQSLPLIAMGLAAYLSVLVLSLAPLLQQEDDAWNRLALTTIITSMGSFSLCLLILLVGVLQASCPICMVSATCSLSLLVLAWKGGFYETKGATSPTITTTGLETTTTEDKNANLQGKVFGSSFLLTVLAAVVFFVSVEESSATNSPLPSLMPTTTVAEAALSSDETAPEKQVLYSPPAVTTKSSPRATQLAKDLQQLEARMYGAYWCSHCYDQKEAFGMPAFGKYIDYVECAKDGMNSQTKVCKAREVPGYPTWEINGELYPGEQELDELEEIVQKAKQAKMEGAELPPSL